MTTQCPNCPNEEVEYEAEYDNGDWSVGVHPGWDITSNIECQDCGYKFTDKDDERVQQELNKLGPPSDD